jgi:hypothetical protein
VKGRFVQTVDRCRIQIQGLEILGQRSLIEIGQRVTLDQVANLGGRQLLIGLSNPDIGLFKGKNRLIVRFGDLQLHDFTWTEGLDVDRGIEDRVRVHLDLVGHLLQGVRAYAKARRISLIIQADDHLSAFFIRESG